MDPLRQTLGVLFVLLLLAGVLWLLRRRGSPWPGAFAGRGERQPLERVARLALSPQSAVELVRIGSRLLVVGVHASGCSLLAALPAEELEAAGVAARTVHPGEVRS